MAVQTLIFGFMYSGLSGDTKPSAANGSLFIETNTGKLHSRESGVWVENLNAAYALPGGGVAWGGITGTLSSQSDLQTALNGKQASGSYASASHTHPQSDVTNLVSDLALKQAILISYSPGSFTVSTETARLVVNHLKLTSSQRATLQGTGRLRVIT